jgi:hypothetical protein
VDIGVDIISDVLGDINVFNCTVSDYDTFNPGADSYGNSESIYIEKILQNGEVNIVGNILRTESPGNMLYSLYVNENNGKLNVESNYLDQYHSGVGNYTYGICVVQTSDTSNIGVSSNVIDSSTDHRTQRCVSLFFTKLLHGALTVYNNIFISTSSQDTTVPTNLITELGSDSNADIIFDSNILIRSGGYQPSSDHQENRPMYMGDEKGNAKIRGTNNLIFDSLSTDPKTTTTITTWYDGYTNENKNITFIGSSSHGSLSAVQYNHFGATYILHFF